MSEYGYTDGDGDGSVCGFGSGSVCGFGSGYGSGYGDGSVCGFGSGYGSGVEIGHAIPDLDYERVRVIVHPWGIAVEIGCQRHSLAVWRARWREIAAAHSVDITYSEAADLFNRASKVPLGEDWVTE